MIGFHSRGVVNGSCVGGRIFGIMESVRATIVETQLNVVLLPRMYEEG